jgi:predicted DNA-binding WGR domain protein
MRINGDNISPYTAREEILLQQTLQAAIASAGHLSPSTICRAFFPAARTSIEQTAPRLFAKSNRSGGIDSKLSLDRKVRARDSDGMIAQPYELYIERRDPARNMARYYVLSIRPTLFGDIQLTRRWGRIGSHGQAMSHSFAREGDAVRLFLDLLRLKRKRGYGPRGRAASPNSRP